MRSRRVGVLIALLGVLLSVLATLPAAADPAVPDGDVPPNRQYERASERELWAKRVRDGRASGSLSEARKHAAVNYAAVWWRITGYDEVTISRWRRFASWNERNRSRTPAEPPLVDITIMTAKEMRRTNRALYDELVERGMRDDDVVSQMVARSTPPKKGERGYHAEEILLRLRYNLEYFDEQLERRGIEEIDQEFLEEMNEDLRPRSRIGYTPKGLIYGVTEREPCSYSGSPACHRYSDLLDHMVPYGDKPERRAAQGDLARILQRMAQENVARLITTTYVRDEVTKARRPFQPAELPGRRYDYEGDDPRRDPPGLERMLDPARQDAGGIDFSNLELRYLAEDPSSGAKGGVRYAFTGQPGGSADTRSALTGARSVNTASDAFFVWLALPESSFWVNLNPNEPHRIVGPQLDRTDVGRIMLDADLQLKKTVGTLIHPDSPQGKRFWSGLQGYNGELCFSHRVWITPKPAKIYDENGELYIIDAPLDVQMEQDYIRNVGTGKHQGCPYQPAEIENHNADVYRRLVLPRLIDSVNTAPEYAALRQIYLSRIAAEWYRERSRTYAMEFTNLIDSGDAARWPATKSWTPMETYSRYLQSYTKGEFHTRSYTYGGVILTEVPKQKVTRSEFERSWPGARTAVTKALNGVSTKAGSGQIWFGGTSTERPERRPRPTRGAERANGIGWPPLLVQVLLLALASAALPLAFVLWRRRTRAGRPETPRP
ncbi:hypothetical protein ABN034_26355 [Actinopolymorpha sp. B11F2]|uniref:hypothetical protein n=1 Tax=Actinopolymorpha sp. B11F2 TaxID=3160862 RepID=UPI0032E3E2B3